MKLKVPKMHCNGCVKKIQMNLLTKGIGRPSDSIMLVDIVSSLERMSDHSVRIAKHTIGYRYPFQHDETVLTKSTL